MDSVIDEYITRLDAEIFKLKYLTAFRKLSDEYQELLEFYQGIMSEMRINNDN
jgi:hypothetical protein